MLPNATWTITNFALLIADTQSVLPASVWIALSVACVVAVVSALGSEGWRPAARRPAGKR
jgi:hypothetical protein